MKQPSLRTCRRFLLTLALCLALIPVFLGGRFSPTRSRPASALANARQVGLAIQMATLDGHGRLPDLHDAPKSLGPYLKNDRVFLSPRTGRPFLFDESLSGSDAERLARPESRVAFYESAPDSGYRTVGFADGRAFRVSEEDWNRRSADGFLVLRPPTPPRQEVLPLLWALAVVALCFAAAHTVAHGRSGGKYLRALLGYGLLYSAILLVPVVLFPAFAQERGTARAL